MKPKLLFILFCLIASINDSGENIIYVETRMSDNNSYCTQYNGHKHFSIFFIIYPCFDCL